MKDITYITGNQNKADYLAKYLGYPISHKKINLEEIQSLDSVKIVRHKVRQAYEIVQGSVLVEDTSLAFKALGKLPGPFMKFFEESMPYEDICSLLDGKDRAAITQCVFGYFDGTNETFFEGSMEGTITKKPSGNRGFGFNCIFIPKGYNKPMSELDEEEYKEVYLTIKPIKQVAEFLRNLQSAK